MAAKKITHFSSITTFPNNNLLVSSPPPCVGGRNSSFQIQNTSKTKCKQAVHDGGDCSSKFTATHKQKASLYKHNGNYKGFIKEEMKYNKSSFEVNNKIQGCTTKYETEVKVIKKVTNFSNPIKGSGHKKVISHANPNKGCNSKPVVNKVTISSGSGKGPGSCGAKIKISYYGY